MQNYSFLFLISLSILIASYIYAKFNWFYSQSWSCFLMALAILYIPFSKSFITLMIDMFINGIVSGIMITGANVHIMDLWGKESGPFMQIGQFTFGLGALTGPLIAGNFLRDIREPNLQSDQSNSTSYFTQYVSSDINLITPYSIVSATAIICSTLSIILGKLYPVLKPHPSRLIQDSTNNSIDKQIETQKTEKELKDESSFKKWRIIVIIISSLFMPLYYGVEVSYGSYVPAFATFSKLHLDPNTAALVASTFWCTFTFFRLFAAFYIQYTGPELNIALSLIVMLSANVVIIPFGENYPIAIWIATILAGIGTSSVWASVFGCLENYFPVTSTMTAGIISATFVGDCVLPVILSNQIEKNPQVFMWIYLASSVSMALLFGLIVLICKKKLTRSTQNSDHQLRQKALSITSMSLVH